MKLSIVTTFTTTRQDPWREALKCYSDLADEVIVVYNKAEREIAEYADKLPNVKCFHMDWPFEYDWSEFPKHYNYALEKATGDWVFKFDIDIFIHENDFEMFRTFLETCDQEAVSVSKISIYGKRYFSKGKLINGINKKRCPELRFGGIKDNKNLDDLVNVIRPIEWRGPVPFGSVPQLVSHVPLHVYNFDYAFKDEEIAKRDYARMARAFKRYFNSDAFGDNDEDAIEKLKKQREHRKLLAVSEVSYNMIPKYVRQKYLRSIK